MKRLLFSLLIVAAFGSISASAATQQDADEGKYSLKCGNLTMTIDAAKGGKSSHSSMTTARSSHS